MKHVFLIASISACTILIVILVSFALKGSPDVLNMSEQSIGAYWNSKDTKTSCTMDSATLSDYNFNFSIKKLNNDYDLIKSNTDGFSIIVTSDTEDQTSDLPKNLTGGELLERSTNDAFTTVMISKIDKNCLTLDYSGVVTDDEITKDIGSDYFNDTNLLERPFATGMIAKWGKKIISAKYLIRETKILSQGNTFVGSASEYTTSNGTFALIEVMTAKNNALIKYTMISNSSGSKLGTDDVQKALEVLANRMILLK
jgi:hypothetical protein